jgi:hypothetical protein
LVLAVFEDGAAIIENPAFVIKELNGSTEKG